MGGGGRGRIGVEACGWVGGCASELRGKTGPLGE